MDSHFQSLLPTAMQHDTKAYLFHQQMARTMWTHPWSWAASMGVGSS